MILRLVKLPEDSGIYKKLRRRQTACAELFSAQEKNIHKQTVLCYNSLDRNYLKNRANM